ncbi:Ankyrin repeat, partial [Sarracenia purpurea var. burkii]
PNLQGNNQTPYLQLHIASVQGDWETANGIISDTRWPGLVKAGITGFLETSLIVAVRSKRRNKFVEELLLKMEPVDLETKDIAGITALHAAAAAANLEATKMLVRKNPNLPNIADSNMLVPLHVAAIIGKRKMVVYLLGVTKENVEPKPFEGERGAKLLNSLAFSGHYDIAIKVLHKYPNIALEEPYLLAALATKRSAFRSGTKLNIWERLLYCC